MSNCSDPKSAPDRKIEITKMRKSSAPSIRCSEIQSAIKKRTTTQRPIQAEFKENLHINSYSEKLCFSVVWSKINARKHKTWEGDGTLEGSGGSFKLKDLSGNFLGSKNSVKAEELLAGNCLVIGSKEIQILERIESSGMASIKNSIEPNDEDCITPVKRKSMSTYTPNLHIPKMKPFSGPADSSARAFSNIPSFIASKEVEVPDHIGVEIQGRIGHSDLSPIQNSLDLSDEDRIAPGKRKTMSCFSPNLNLPKMKLSAAPAAKRPANTIQVAGSLLKHLRPHQRSGIAFLCECIQGYRNVDHFGAILADEMGLGKTLQCLSVCYTLLKNGSNGTDPVLRRVLIVAPSSLTQHWDNEITKWFSSERLFAYVVGPKNKLKQFPNARNIPFVVTSYEMLTNNCTEFEKIEFDLVVCDEGHRLKNNSIKAAICLRQLNVKRKIILTGTPIQNDLQEFYSLVDFVNPGILGNYQEYKFQYETPIVMSQTADASEDTKLLGQERADQLTEITKQFILRRTQNVIQKYLPKKTEFVVFVMPTELQQFMLKKLLEWYETKNDSVSTDCNALQIITLMKKICNHPSLIKTTSKLDSRLLQYLLNLLPNWNEMGPFDSAKLELVRNFLHEAITEQKEKIVLVSNHTKTLDMLMEICSHFNYSHLRLDGSTTSNHKNSAVEKFNDPKSEISVFLLSSKAGGVGLNLSGASRLVLFDNDWNPAIDLQAMSRIWRDGQTKDVKIYRLITAGTIEEKIFQRQIGKTTLGGCVMNQCTNKADTMKFSDEDLKDLFTVQEDFDTCATHNILNCNCRGIGEATINGDLVEERNPIDSQEAGTENSLQMNQLMYWKHYKSPINENVLKDACLTNAAEDIIFMFSNTTEATT